MDAIKIMVLAITGTMLTLVLKEQKQSLGMTLAVLCALSVFFAGLPYLEEIVTYVRTLHKSLGAVGSYIGVLLKITGIATISGMAAKLCADAGMSAVSAAVTLSGKVICISLVLPVIAKFLNGLLSILP